MLLKLIMFVLLFPVRMNENIQFQVSTYLESTFFRSFQVPLCRKLHTHTHAHIRSLKEYSISYTVHNSTRSLELLLTDYLQTHCHASTLSNSRPDRSTRTLWPGFTRSYQYSATGDNLCALQILQCGGAVLAVDATHWVRLQHE